MIKHGCANLLKKYFSHVNWIDTALIQTYS